MKGLILIFTILWSFASNTGVLSSMESPSFKGGQPDSFAQWVNERLEYPSDALKEKVEGCVVLRFTIAENGKLGDIEVLRSCHPSLDSAAVKVVSASPKWRPAYKDGRPVSYTCNLPIAFKIKRK